MTTMRRFLLVTDSGAIRGEGCEFTNGVVCYFPAGDPGVQRAYHNLKSCFQDPKNGGEPWEAPRAIEWLDPPKRKERGMVTDSPGGPMAPEPVNAAAEAPSPARKVARRKISARRRR